MASSSSSKDKKKPGKPSGGIHTLADFNRRPADDDSDSDGPPEYYTGGEKSGMLVQDPSKDSGKDVESFFEQARQRGAMEGTLDPSIASSNSRSFTGTARLLSGEALPAAPPPPPQPVIHNIVFWRNGFSVNDGPLRSLNDPENAAFLESVKNSQCPEELAPADRRTPVHVSLERRDENYIAPEKPYSPFQGVGRTLGWGTSTAATAASAPTSSPAPFAGLVVDNTRPSTSIQLRLNDGTRMVARFNLHHTIGDIRGFIDASRRGGYPPYHLQTVGFPPKQLTDMSETIEQAGLANSVVLQKF